MQGIRGIITLVSTVFRPNPGFIMREIAGEALLVPVGAQTRIMNGMITLTQTGSFLWKAMDGKRTVMELTVLLAEECSVSPDAILDDVIAFLDKAEKNGLIVKI